MNLFFKTTPSDERTGQGRKISDVWFPPGNSNQKYHGLRDIFVVVVEKSSRKSIISTLNPRYIELGYENHATNFIFLSFEYVLLNNGTSERPLLGNFRVEKHPLIDKETASSSPLAAEEQATVFFFFTSKYRSYVNCGETNNTAVLAGWQTACAGFGVTLRCFFICIFHEITAKRQNLPHKQDFAYNKQPRSASLFEIQRETVWPPTGPLMPPLILQTRRQ